MLKDVKFIEWCFLIVCVFILFFYIFIQLSPPRLTNIISLPIIEKVSKDYIIGNAGVCDLLFLSGNTSGEKTCRWFTGSCFSHVAMLFRTLDVNDSTKTVAYVWESDLGCRAKDGPRVIRLKDKLKRYKGYRIGGYRKLIANSVAIKPNESQLLDIITRYVDKDFDEYIMSWFVSGNNAISQAIYNTIKNEDTVFCSELVASTLRDIKILPSDRKPSWYSPASFLYNMLRYNDGYSYGPLKIFDF